MASFDKFNLKGAGQAAPAAAGESPAEPKPAELAAKAAEPEPSAEKKAEGKPGKAGRKGKDKPARTTAERAQRRLAAACGVACAVAVASLGIGGAELMGAVRARDEVAGSTEKLVTLTRSVSAGDVISESDLEVSDVPAAFAPADAATEASQVAGRVAVVDMTEGNAVSRASLSGSETASRLPAAVSAGNVGYMLSLSSTADAASPMLRPGDRVDVMAGGDGADAYVACHDVRILAVDGSLDPSAASAGYSTVTLDLTYEQAAELFTCTQVASQSVHLLVLPSEAALAGEAQ